MLHVPIAQSALLPQCIGVYQQLSNVKELKDEWAGSALYTLGTEHEEQGKVGPTL